MLLGCFSSSFWDPGRHVGREWGRDSRRFSRRGAETQRRREPGTVSGQLSAVRGDGRRGSGRPGEYSPTPDPGPRTPDPGLRTPDCGRRTFAPFPNPGSRSVFHHRARRGHREPPPRGTAPDPGHRTLDPGLPFPPPSLRRYVASATPLAFPASGLRLRTVRRVSSFCGSGPGVPWGLRRSRERNDGDRGSEHPRERRRKEAANERQETPIRNNCSRVFTSIRGCWKGRVMARREKLLDKMRNLPGSIRFHEVEALLKYEGFVLFNQRGSHGTYHRADGRVLTIAEGIRP